MSFLRLMITSLLAVCVLTYSNCYANEASDFEMTPVSVADGVYSIVAPYYGRPSKTNRGWNANSHFIVTNEGVLVIDTGSSAAIGNSIIKTIRSVTTQPIRWVVNSHSHADHWLGNGAFAALGVEIMATPSAAQAMREEGEDVVNAFFRMTDGATGDSPLAYPGSLINSPHTRRFGGVEVAFLFSDDGHSPGDMLLWLPQQRIVLGGDVLSSQWLPIMTPRGHVPQLIQTLRHVQTLQPIVVLPGHGDVASAAMVERDLAFLGRAWAMVQQGRLRQAPLAELQMSLQQALGPVYRQHYKDFDASINYLVAMMFQKPAT